MLNAQSSSLEMCHFNTQVLYLNPCTLTSDIFNVCGESYISEQGPGGLNLKFACLVFLIDYQRMSSDVTYCIALHICDCDATDGGLWMECQTGFALVPSRASVPQLKFC